MFSSDDDIWYDACEHVDDDHANILFNEQGDYLYRNSSFHQTYLQNGVYNFDDALDSCVCVVHPTFDVLDANDHHLTRLAFDHAVQRAPPDSGSL
jgi:hypothetical protein